MFGMRTSVLLAITTLLALCARAAPALAVLPFVVDGADVTVFLSDPAPLRFRIQNNTLADTEFDWEITGGPGSLTGTVVVPALKDALVVEEFGGTPVAGEIVFTITLTPVLGGPPLMATQSVTIRDPFDFPSVMSDESEVIVDEPIQKPILIVTPASPQPGLPNEREKTAIASPARAAGSSASEEALSFGGLPFVVTVSNPDPGSTADLFVVNPITGVITGPPSTTIVQNVTISLPPGGVPVGTMNTIRFTIFVDGDTVHASGQAIYQGSCGVAEPQCGPTFVSSRWSQSTYDDYQVGPEMRSLWCGSLNTPGWPGGTGYGSCWDSKVYLNLGTRVQFSASQGMTLGGVQLYSSELAHDLCMIELGAGANPDTITAWKKIASYSGISRPDSITCGNWATNPHLCARYETFDVRVAAEQVPDNSMAPLFVRFRFESDLTKSDQGGAPPFNTKGAWRIDHLFAKGDLTPVNSYYPPDPLRQQTQTFEAPLPPNVWYFPLTTIYDCTAVDEGTAAAAADNPSWIAAEPNPSSGASRLRFQLPQAAQARIVIYDISGRAVRELPLGPLRAGEHEAVWDGRQDNGRAVSSGHYVARLIADDRATALRLARLRR
jgi:hypothetical protein